MMRRWLHETERSDVQKLDVFTTSPQNVIRVVFEDGAREPRSTIAPRLPIVEPLARLDERSLE